MGYNTKQTNKQERQKKRTRPWNKYPNYYFQVPKIFIHLVVSNELCNFLNAITCFKILGCNSTNIMHKYNEQKNKWKTSLTRNEEKTVRGCLNSATKFRIKPQLNFTKDVFVQYLPECFQSLLKYVCFSDKLGLHETKFLGRPIQWKWHETGVNLSI